MKNRAGFFVVFLISVIIFTSLYAPGVKPIYAEDALSVTFNSDNHTILFPLEKSFRFVCVVKNNSSNQVDFSANLPKGQDKNTASPNTNQFTILATEGFYRLDPGEETELSITFEAQSSRDSQPITMETVLTIESGGAKKEIPITIKTEYLDNSALAQDECRVNVRVLSKDNKSPITDAVVLAITPSGHEKIVGEPSGDEYLLRLINGEKLKGYCEKYQVDHKYQGYYLNVFAPGYTSYFESGYLPVEETKEIYLEKLAEVGQYGKTAEIETGYSIWWIRSSKDGRYFAFSQGTHGGPDIPEPKETRVVYADSAGKVLWEKTVPGQCWGLDISSNANYVAAGCMSGNIYMWDREGNEVLNYSTDNSPVRWVKFSDDEKYLLAGPVEKRSENAGIFDVESRKLLWSYYIDGYLRQGKFSNDGKTVYLASSSGGLFALGTADGKLAWSALTGYFIPFILGQSDSAGIIVSAGKGRVFNATSINSGERLWLSSIDQTITAGGVDINGNTLGASVGGMVYLLNEKGDVKWARSYGGVGHNGAFITQNGGYVLLGGPNPTLFDKNGNILWQREKGKAIEMTGPNTINTGDANCVWMSDDGSLLILGGDDGLVEFYSGIVKKGENSYPQLMGPNIHIPEGNKQGNKQDNKNEPGKKPPQDKPEGDAGKKDIKKTENTSAETSAAVEGAEKKPANATAIIIYSIAGFCILAAVVAVVLILINKKKKNRR